LAYKARGASNEDVSCHGGVGSSTSAVTTSLLIG
jgi:hypothetical protein